METVDLRYQDIQRRVKKKLNMIMKEDSQKNIKKKEKKIEI